MESLIKINASLSNKEEVTLREKVNEIFFDKNEKRNIQQNIVTVYFTDTISFSDTIKSTKTKKNKQFVIFIYSDKNELAPEILKQSDYFVQKTKELCNEGLSQELLEIKKRISTKVLESPLNGGNEDDFLYIFGNGRKEALKINVNDILSLEAYGSMTTITYLIEGKITERKINDSISTCEKSLPADLFYRVHRRFIVNGKKVKRISPKSNLELNIDNEKVVSIARRRKNDFWKWYNSHEF